MAQLKGQNKLAKHGSCSKIRPATHYCLFQILTNDMVEAIIVEGGQDYSHKRSRYDDVTIIS
ncbi:hypothetical protein [Nostoc sp. FACHB-110]|uniref:hypothetical protein n=1 Tax=Nostoc sp. FACHB-110 TaxID=2692834 RepID=UPI001683E4B7|nr:hypothetical protein [Nostoc sp. FACHB-110]MBD2435966.1 hypothetical protein [Nostoc sp. FACHB-110]